MKGITRCHLFLIGWISLSLSTSCNEDTFHAYKTVDSDGWNRLDTLTFTIDSLPAEKDYQMEVGLRTTRHYPYKSLWLIVESQFNKPDMIFTDTVECFICDSTSQRTGYGLHSLQNTYPLYRFYLQRGQTGHVRIRHHMIHENIKGVGEVGIRLYPL